MRIGGEFVMLRPCYLGSQMSLKHETEMGGFARISTISGVNLVALIQHFEGELTSSMQNIHHSWSSVHVA